MYFTGRAKSLIIDEIPLLSIDSMSGYWYWGHKLNWYLKNTPNLKYIPLCRNGVNKLVEKNAKKKTVDKAGNEAFLTVSGDVVILGVVQNRLYMARIPCSDWPQPSPPRRLTI